MCELLNGRTTQWLSARKFRQTAVSGKVFRFVFWNRGGKRESGGGMDSFN